MGSYISNLLVPLVFLQWFFNFQQFSILELSKSKPLGHKDFSCVPSGPKSTFVDVDLKSSQSQ